MPRLRPGNGLDQNLVVPHIQLRRRHFDPVRVVQRRIVFLFFSVQHVLVRVAAFGNPDFGVFRGLGRLEFGGLQVHAGDGRALQLSLDSVLEPQPHSYMLFVIYKRCERTAGSGSRCLVCVFFERAGGDVGWRSGLDRFGPYQSCCLLRPAYCFCTALILSN